MKVKQVKEIGRQWVSEEASKAAGFYGAYFIGSINWMAEEDPFPATSDVDIKVVSQGPEALPEQAKFVYRDIVLDASYVHSSQFQSADTILGQYPAACHFATPNIIADPSGQLTRIQAEVARDYARRKWVYRRCEDARNRFPGRLAWLDESEPFHEQVLAWLVLTFLPTHIVLVAGLRNPTTRTCFVKAREVLARFEQLQLYDSLLDLLGSRTTSRSQAERALAALAEVIDVAKVWIKTPFFLSDNISDVPASALIEGCRELIERSDHREAMWWMAIVHTMCQKTLFNDAPEKVQQMFEPSYRQLLRDLGVHSYADLLKRNEHHRDVLLSATWEVAEMIIASNPEAKE